MRIAVCMRISREATEAYVNLSYLYVNLSYMYVHFVFVCAFVSGVDILLVLVFVWIFVQLCCLLLQPSLLWLTMLMAANPQLRLLLQYYQYSSTSTDNNITTSTTIPNTSIITVLETDNSCKRRRQL